MLRTAKRLLMEDYTPSEFELMAAEYAVEELNTYWFDGGPTSPTLGKTPTEILDLHSAYRHAFEHDYGYYDYCYEQSEMEHAFGLFDTTIEECDEYYADVCEMLGYCADL